MLIKVVLLEKFFRMESFSSFKISKQLHFAIEELGYENPTPIQLKSFPVIQSGKDMIGIAQTGTGKTVAFGIPLLQLIDTDSMNVQVVILAPTRELGQQIHANLVAYASENPSISMASVCGGIPIKPQIERLKTPIPRC